MLNDNNNDSNNNQNKYEKYIWQMTINIQIIWKNYHENQWENIFLLFPLFAATSRLQSIRIGICITEMRNPSDLQNLNHLFRTVGLFESWSMCSIGLGTYISDLRSSQPGVFLGKGVLKICNKFTGEHPLKTSENLWF